MRAQAPLISAALLLGERALHTGDEIVLGRLRLLFRGPVRGKQTAAIAEAPPLTQRECDVLLALCRPRLASDPGENDAQLGKRASLPRNC